MTVVSKYQTQSDPLATYKMLIRPLNMMKAIPVLWPFVCAYMVQYRYLLSWNMSIKAAGNSSVSWNDEYLGNKVVEIYYCSNLAQDKIMSCDRNVTDLKGSDTKKCYITMRIVSALLTPQKKGLGYYSNVI